MGTQMHGVRWRDFKLVLVAQKYVQDVTAKLPAPRVINMTGGPQEREPVALPRLHTWAATHFNRLITEVEASVQCEWLIPMRALLGHVLAV